MPGPMFNPGMGNRCGMMKSPEQIQQEMNQLMQQYNNMYQNMSNRMPMNEPAQIVNDTFANRRRDEYSEVHDPSEVEQGMPYPLLLRVNPLWTIRRNFPLKMSPKRNPLTLDSIA